MKRTLLLLLFSYCSLAAATETVLRQFRPADFAPALRNGNELTANNNAEAEVTFQALEIPAPKIETRWYALIGEVKYDVSQGAGYLEMWSYFHGGGHYFSRTLAPAGPMAALRGSSPWRKFAVPFDSTGAAGAPERLQLNVSLPAHGRAELRNVRLVALDAAGFAAAISTADLRPWRSAGAAGLIGGLGGALLGCFGSLVEWLAVRGRGARFVLIGCRVVIALGVAALGAGFLALAWRQPAGTCYALLLLGVLSVCIMPVRLRRYQAHYRELELRRMQSLDAV